MAGLACLAGLLSSTPKGRTIDILWRDSRFHLQNSENKAALLSLLRSRQPYSSLPSTRLVFVLFNWKPRVCQDKSETFSFEELCDGLGTVSPSLQSLQFQNLMGLELPIKHPMHRVYSRILSNDRHNRSCV